MTIHREENTDSIGVTQKKMEESTHCRNLLLLLSLAQSCPTPSDAMDCSPPGSSVHGIFQARVLEWGAITFYSRNLREVYFQDIFRLRFPPNCLYLFYF